MLHTKRSRRKDKPSFEQLERRRIDFVTKLTADKADEAESDLEIRNATSREQHRADMSSQKMRTIT